MNFQKRFYELEDRYGEITGLSTQSAYSPDFVSWRSRLNSLLEELFGTGSEPLERFRAIYFTPLFLSCRLDEDVFLEAFRDGLEEAGRLLAELLDKGGIAIQHK